MTWKGFLASLDALIEEIVHGDKGTIVLDHIAMPQNTPQASVGPTVENPDVLTVWGPQKSNYHNTRVLCDIAGLTLVEKNIICACVYQESGFYNYLPDGKPVSHENLNKDGSLSSTDWGICQINDWFHIEPNGSPFASVEYVLANPQACIQFMIDMFKEGQLSQWDSYKSGAYRQWLLSTSPMWQLTATL